MDRRRLTKIIFLYQMTQSTNTTEGYKMDQIRAEADCVIDALAQRPSPRRKRILLFGLVGLVAPMVAITGAAASPAKAAHKSQGASSQVGAANSFSPQLKHTGKKPTGYTVTFRYRDASATSVQIKGEWYFSDPAKTTQLSSQGLLPSQWYPGVVPIDFPNAPAANWPVLNLQENVRTGVWSLTVPLPSGVFSYGFFVNCADPTQATCTEVSDPSNPPWNDINGTSSGSVEPTSQVYVPSDHAFGTVNYSWQRPAAKHGNLVDVSYPSPGSTMPLNTHPLAIYTPPGYNPFRAKPYPTLYLSHGGGGNGLTGAHRVWPETSWTTRSTPSRSSLWS
jgi:hypothetical protein